MGLVSHGATLLRNRDNLRSLTPLFQDQSVKLFVIWVDTIKRRSVKLNRKRSQISKSKTNQQPQQQHTRHA